MLRNGDSYGVLFFLVFMIANIAFVFQFNLLFVSATIAVAIMFIGQVLLFFPFSLSYFFYFLSCFYATTITTLYWIVKNFEFSEASLLIYGVSAGILTAIPLIAHWFTKTRIDTSRKIPLFSMFLFGLFLSLGISQTMDANTYYAFFGMTIILFVFISIFGLNMTFRTMKLNRRLKIRTKNNYLRKTKEKLFQKYTTTKRQEDIDLIMYYLSSSIEAFINGDFERSFMDAFKIIDNEGKAFKRICICSLTEEQWKYYSDIRNNLSHARISNKKDKNDKNDGKKAEKKEQLNKLKEIKKNLFQDTLNILEIVNNDFIAVALKD